MILVDTSVWVDHLRRHQAPLAARLERGEILCHPFVIGEMSLGPLRRRNEVLELLSALPMASVVSHDEVLMLVERRGLAGQGIGWIDAHLLASVLVDRTRLWTFDRRLAAVARAMLVSLEG